MGRYEDALDDFDRAIEQEPDDARAITQRGLTYQMMEQYERALTDFNHAIELKPDYAWAVAHRGLTYRMMGEHSAAQSDFAQAIHLARQVYQKNPQNWRNAFYLALYHLAAGETAEAERLYREALSGGASQHCIREAIRELEYFLILCPDHPEACAMRDLLQQHLQEAQR